GMGNLGSVVKAFEVLGAMAVVTSDPRDLARASRIVLPGVGAFGEGIRHLLQADLVEPLRREVLAGRKPFLGICLGMQLLARESVEHGRHEGLGWIPGTVEAIDGCGSGVKSIHIGWNDVSPANGCPLFHGLGASPSFYFVHRYHLICEDRLVAA